MPSSSVETSSVDDNQDISANIEGALHRRILMNRNIVTQQNKLVMDDHSIPSCSRNIIRTNVGMSEKGLIANNRTNYERDDDISSHPFGNLLQTTDPTKLSIQQSNNLNFALSMALSCKESMKQGQQAGEPSSNTTSHQERHKQRIKRLAEVLRKAYQEGPSSLSSLSSSAVPPPKNVLMSQQIPPKVKDYVSHLSVNSHTNGSVSLTSSDVMTALKRLKSEPVLCTQERHAETKRRKSENISTHATITTTASSISSSKPSKKRHLFERIQSKVRQDSSSSPINVVQCPQITPPRSCTPQAFLDNLLSSRGYSTQTYPSLQTGYHCRPTPLQTSSYGIELVQTVRTGNARNLDRILQCGLSPNPCNSFGESIVHMVCRKQNADLLKVLMKHGCTLQFSDDYGRTPLHDACWTARPNFDCIELIMMTDWRLFYISDLRGNTPLTYVPKANYEEWMRFIDRVKDVYWPCKNDKTDGMGSLTVSTTEIDSTTTTTAAVAEDCPELVRIGPNVNYVKDPDKRCSDAVAVLIASGKLKPEVHLRERI